jgi:hypothetical protein
MSNLDKTIFVGIAAYNEPDLEQTINNCLENAVNADRITFGVWAHYNKEKMPNLDKLNVKYIECHEPGLLGVCVGRTNAASLYSNEDFYLQIDAHMLFEKDWDEKVLSAYYNIKNKFDKPIITTYVPWWSRSEDGTINFYDPNSEGTQSFPMNYLHETTEEGYPRQQTFAVDWQQHDYYEHCGFSAHFAFTSASFIHDIVPDIRFAFGGEEPTTALRAWSNGYRMFAIKNPIVWHRNKFHGVISKYDRLNYPGPKGFGEYFYTKNADGIARCIDILTGKILGYWGADSIETLNKYHKFAGTDFSNFRKETK